MASSSLFIAEEKLFFQHSAVSRPDSPTKTGSSIHDILPSQLPQDEGKLTKFTDADCSRDTFVINVNGTQLLIRKRPFLEEFLKEAAERFELIAYTAGSAEYANLVLDTLDPYGKYFRHRLYRQHCTYKCGENFVKDLRVVNRSLSRTVLVDNNAHSFLMQLGNGIPIASFINDVSDKALVTLFHFLLLLDPERDVRHSLSKIFRLEVMLGELARTSISLARSHIMAASTH